MNTLPLTMRYLEDEGKLEINSEITEGLALGIETALDQFFTYYQYPRVTLRINSPGGSLLGLTHILQSVEQWRAAGKEVRTEATFLAASAGALLLALGEVGSRAVQRHTSLLFHHTRIDGSRWAITAGRADQLADVLRKKDRGLLQRLVTHVAEGFGGVGVFAQEGVARCDLLKRQSAALHEELNISPKSRSSRWIQSISSIHQGCATRKSTAGYQLYLEKRLESDTPMDFREAYALNLIDRVHMVPALVAAARSEFRPAPAVPHMRLAA